MMMKLLFSILALSSVWGGPLPSPYDRAVVYPFLEHGWYSHADFFENYMREHQVKTIIEVGSWLGTSTRHLAKCLPNDGLIYAVDHWLGSEEHQSGQPFWSPALPKLYELFLSNVMHERLTSKIIPVRLDSFTASQTLSVMADIVFIDASHDEESVYYDLKTWFPHVKRGGILCGNAWHYPPLVAAVNRFAREEDLDIEVDSVFILKKKDRLAHAKPIQFSMPEEKIVDCIPEKDSDFAHCIPGQPGTYIFKTEAEYYHSYKRALYGVTKRKAGWDCMRHCEILANGCIPYFIDLESCDPKTLAFLPKDLILEAMHLPGVSYLKIDHSVFDRAKYDELLNKILAHTREHLSSRKMAEYLLSESKYTGKGPVLYLSQHQEADYLRCTMLIGLRHALGANAIDVPRIHHLYKDYPHPQQCYGGGMSYACVLDPIEIDRDRILERIMAREFELIIYGAVHNGCPYLDLVRRFYPPERIVYMCGYDCHSCDCAYGVYPKESPFFLREFTAY
jgi:Methyltransferase domain